MEDYSKDGIPTYIFQTPLRILFLYIWYHLHLESPLDGNDKMLMSIAVSFCMYEDISLRNVRIETMFDVRGGGERWPDVVICAAYTPDNRPISI